jgi:succinylglutamic semialdehyde dehydrogenase
MRSILRSYEPATGTLLWEGAPAVVADEILVVERSWAEWASLPGSHRVEAVRRFANALRGSEERFCELIARETGRPLWDTRAEIQGLVKQIDYSIGAASERAGQRRLEGALGSRQALRHRPHGIMAVIGSAAQPARIAGEHLATALLAGNGVLFKPSEKTPVIGQCLVDLLHGAGVPETVLRCVIGDAETGAQLIADPRINGVLFTGTSKTGYAIARAIGGNPDKLLSLNMGGNNPVIVWDNGDLASAAALVVQSAFTSSGQNCLSARRLIVAETIAEPLIQELKHLSERLHVDHPHAEDVPFMGPMIDMEAADGLTDGFLHLLTNGGRPILHMKRPFPELPFVTPGIVDVTDMAERPDTEYFGPLLQVIRVPTFEQAMAAANESRYGLCAALIGGTPEQYDLFWSSCRAGIINWNRPTTAAPVAAPIGGLGLSGNHRPGGSYAADFCAYPVVSSALDQPRAVIGIGLRPAGQQPRAAAA